MAFLSFAAARKALSIVSALGASATGLWAAWKWYKASTVQIDLGYHLPGMPGGTVRRLGIDVARFPESGDAEARHANETSATWEAMAESAKLNKEAAFWTAISVALGALSAVAGAF